MSDISNATFFDTVNRVSVDSGQAPIASTSDFDSNSLEKPFLQCKNVVSEMHTELLRGMRPSWMLKKWRGTLTAATSGNNVGQQVGWDIYNAAVFSPVNQVYQNQGTFASTTCAENIVPDSMRLIDPTGLIDLQKIEFVDYNVHRQLQWDNSLNMAPPTHFWVVPWNADGNSLLGFYPAPDQAYKIEFLAFQDPITLINNDDIIQFPPKWQNILWKYSRMYYEIVLSEGKAPTISQFLDPLWAEIRQNTRGPSEDYSAVDVGIVVGGRSRYRREWF